MESYKQKANAMNLLPACSRPPEGEGEHVVQNEANSNIVLMFL